MNYSLEISTTVSSYPLFTISILTTDVKDLQSQLCIL